MPRKARIDAPIRHRTRGPQDPVLLTDCNYCGHGFWYRPSMGLPVHNGYAARLRVSCGWCSKNNYVDPYKGD